MNIRNMVQEKRKMLLRMDVFDTNNPFDTFAIRYKLDNVGKEEWIELSVALVSYIAFGKPYSMNTRNLLEFILQAIQKEPMTVIKLPRHIRTDTHFLRLVASCDKYLEEFLFPEEEDFVSHDATISKLAYNRLYDGKPFAPQEFFWLKDVLREAIIYENFCCITHGTPIMARKMGISEESFQILLNGGLVNEDEFVKICAYLQPSAEIKVFWDSHYVRHTKKQ